MSSQKVVDFPKDKRWMDALIKIGDPPRPKAILANCLIAFRTAPDWHGILSYNEFAGRLWIHSPDPRWAASTGREWSDNDDRLAAEWLQQHGIFVTTAIAADAIQTVAREHTFNPLLDFLNNLEWDGWNRVDTWLHAYLGTENNAYTRAVGRAWLISSVARAFQPGCKADCCLILEGPQGRGKSTIMRTLVGSELYSDSMAHDLGGREAAMLCAGAWVIELSELESLRQSALGAMKAFLSRSEDRFRRPYDRHPVRVPRQCVFVGTTNKVNTGYFNDETGNRRFWPVVCGTLMRDEIERDREQIWAEAVKMYCDGIPWWLDKDLEREARREQAARLERDPWHEAIAEWVGPEGRRSSVSISEILADCIHKNRDEWTRADQMRVSAVLVTMGMEQFHTTDRKQRRYRWPIRMMKS